MRDITRRLALYLGGCIVATLCYAVTVRAAIGLGPLFAVQDGVSELTGLTLGRSVMVVGTALLLLSWLVGERPRSGTLAMPFISGVILDLVLPHIPAIHGMGWRVTAVVVATWIMCLGGAMAIESNLGMSALDGVMMGLHRLSRRPLAHVRLAMEATMLVVGWSLGGAVGVGTVITGALVGPGLHFWLARLNSGSHDSALARVPAEA